MRKTSALWLLGLPLILALPESALAASADSSMRKGLKAYEQGLYPEALSRFTEAEVESPDDLRIQFNRSSAHYQTRSYEEAAKGFEQVISRSEDPALKEKAFYNLGNTAYSQGDLQRAADAYRKALSLDSSDLEAKQNLEFVLKKIQEQEQQKQQGQDRKQEASDGDDQDSEKEETQPEAESGQEQTEKPSDETQPEGSRTEETPGQTQAGQEDAKEQPGQGEIREAEAGQAEREDGPEEQAPPTAEATRGTGLSAEEAERLLNSLSDDQRAFLRQQAQRAAPKSSKNAKDW